MHQRRSAAMAAGLCLALGWSAGCKAPPECGNGTAEEGEQCDDGNRTAGDGCNADCVAEPLVECGDGVAGAGELCDGADLGGQSCTTLGQGFTGGTLACAADCTLDASGCTAIATCGDGAVGAGEDCEPGSPPVLGAADCVNLGFEGGTLGCFGTAAAAPCTFDTAGCFECGDGARDATELCDGTDLNAETCASLGVGFTGGTLACSPTCTFDISGCATCGDGVAEGGEPCDGPDLAGETCVSQGFDAGALACTVGCTFETVACASCGDGVRTAPEPCDGTDLGGAACTTIGQGWAGGVLACSACAYDTSACTAPASCGNGTIDTGAGEECDGALLGGASCVSLGHGAGTLACTGGCAFDESGCSTCGNDVIEATEVCDGADLAGQTCTTQGHDAGTLGCAADCSALDAAACSDCGDSLAEPPEACDGADLGGATCMSEGFGDGSVACDAACGVDTSGCYTCGNGVRESAETCDGANLAGATCASRGWAGGALACAAGCLGYDESGCTNCGNGVVDAGEECDGADLAGGTCAGQGATAGTLGCTASCTFDTAGCIYASMECIGWCTCQLAYCGTAPTNPYTGPTAYDDCLTDCSGLSMSALDCRTTHCGYAMTDPTTHCPHSVGLSVCM